MAFLFKSKKNNKKSLELNIKLPDYKEEDDIFETKINEDDQKSIVKEKKRKKDTLNDKTNVTKHKKQRLITSYQLEKNNEISNIKRKEELEIEQSDNIKEEKIDPIIIINEIKNNDNIFKTINLHPKLINEIDIWLNNIKNEVIQTNMIKVIIGPAGVGKTFAIKNFLNENSNLYEMVYFNINEKYLNKNDTIKLKNFWEREFYPSITPNYSNGVFESEKLMNYDNNKKGLNIQKTKVIIVDNSQLIESDSEDGINVSNGKNAFINPGFKFSSNIMLPIKKFSNVYTELKRIPSKNHKGIFINDNSKSNSYEDNKQYEKKCYPIIFITNDLDCDIIKILKKWEESITNNFNNRFVKNNPGMWQFFNYIFLDNPKDKDLINYFYIYLIPYYQQYFIKEFGFKFIVERENYNIIARKLIEYSGNNIYKMKENFQFIIYKSMFITNSLIESKSKCSLSKINLLNDFYNEEEKELVLSSLIILNEKCLNCYHKNKRTETIFSKLLSENIEEFFLYSTKKITLLNKITTENYKNLRMNVITCYNCDNIITKIIYSTNSLKIISPIILSNLLEKYSKIELIKKSFDINNKKNIVNIKFNFLTKSEELFYDNIYKNILFNNNKKITTKYIEENKENKENEKNEKKSLPEKMISVKIFNELIEKLNINYLKINDRKKGEIHIENRLKNFVSFKSGTQLLTNLKKKDESNSAKIIFLNSGNVYMNNKYNEMSLLKKKEFNEFNRENLSIPSYLKNTSKHKVLIYFLFFPLLNAKNYSRFDVNCKYCSEKTHYYLFTYKNHTCLECSIFVILKKFLLDYGYISLNNFELFNFGHDLIKVLLSFHMIIKTKISKKIPLNDKLEILFENLSIEKCKQLDKIFESWLNEFIKNLSECEIQTKTNDFSYYYSTERLLILLNSIIFYPLLKLNKIYTSLLADFLNEESHKKNPNDFIEMVTINMILDNYTKIIQNNKFFSQLSKIEENNDNNNNFDLLIDNEDKVKLKSEKSNQGLFSNPFWIEKENHFSKNWGKLFVSPINNVLRIIEYFPHLTNIIIWIFNNNKKFNWSYNPINLLIRFGCYNEKYFNELKNNYLFEEVTNNYIKIIDNSIDLIKNIKISKIPNYEKINKQIWINNIIKNTNILNKKDLLNLKLVNHYFRNMVNKILIINNFIDYNIKNSTNIYQNLGWIISEFNFPYKCIHPEINYLSLFWYDYTNNLTNLSLNNEEINQFIQKELPQSKDKIILMNNNNTKRSISIKPTNNLKGDMKKYEIFLNNYYLNKIFTLKEKQQIEIIFFDRFYQYERCLLQEGSELINQRLSMFQKFNITWKTYTFIAILSGINIFEFHDHFQNKMTNNEKNNFILYAKNYFIKYLIAFYFIFIGMDIITINYFFNNSYENSEKFSLPGYYASTNLKPSFCNQEVSFQNLIKNLISIVIESKKNKIK